MSGPPKHALFKNLKADGLPPFEPLGDERLQILWILAIGDQSDSTRHLTATEISDVLREVYGHAVSRQRVAAILGAERKTIHHSKKDGRWVYRIMAPGKAELEATPSTVVFVRPEEALSGLRSVQEIFGSAVGEVRVCDPYVDGRTLDMLADFGAAAELRLLTQHIDKAAAFKHEVGLFTKQHAKPLQIRIASAKVLHDRYVIHDDGMLLSGTSLNGLGKKQSFVVSLPEDIRETTLAAFEAYWAAATPL